ncbi:MAG: hypothetical protein LUF34_03005 [Lachnospiraceae bacterium]|nr:hypothetical protein [Lachnospiraceae bacterium]
MCAEGERKVGFRFYRLGVDDRRESHYSMANAGFEKPGILRPGKENVLLLTIREMNAASASNGRAMQGHLETLKYPYNGTMQLAASATGKCAFLWTPSGSAAARGAITPPRLP